MSEKQEIKSWLQDVFFDLLNDIPSYLEDAAKKYPCSVCEGSGKHQREVNSADLIAALLEDMGARTTHQYPGDECINCGGEGYGVDREEVRAEAAKKITSDWQECLSDGFKEDGDFK